MKNNFIFLLLIFGFLSSCGLSEDKDEKQVSGLIFNDTGELKIAQFTDLHFNMLREESATVIELINYILDAEEPDLVVFTGDVVTAEPSMAGWRSVLEPVVQRNIPFAATLGNHDAEKELSRNEVREIIASYQGSLLSEHAQNVSESGDFFINLIASGGSEIAGTLYFMDSNAYSTLENVGGWGWFTFDQVEWFRQQSLNIRIRNQDSIIPALAFFHIPLPEYREAFDSESAMKVGQRLEDECSPEINTGMFAAMLQAGDVMGTFTGHDHVNDYIVGHYGIALGYGRFSGGKNSYGDLMPGSRIIVLSEGERKFRTWLHLANGDIIDDVLFPDYFTMSGSQIVAAIYRSGPVSSSQ